MKANNEKRKRITGTFSDPILEKLESHKQERGLTTYGECLNEIVELGFQKKEENILAANDPSLRSQSTSQTSPELTELLAIKRMLLNNSAWVMEIRLLNRYLVKKIPNQSKEKGLENLKRFKKRASDFIVKMMNARVSKQDDTAPEKEGVFLMEKTQKTR